MAKPIKVFGIGLNRTGTSSLKIAFRRLGYDHSVCKMELAEEYFRGNLEACYSEAEAYDSFEDWPWPLVYKEIFAKYGDNARYILTTRASGDKWLQSIKKHSERARGRELRRRIFGYPFPHGVEDIYLKYYENHNAEVRRFFDENNATHLLKELCWENGDGWLELCVFLNEPLRATNFPQVNMADDSTQNAQVEEENEQMIAWQLQKLNR